jgi:hypothetical protein
MTKAKVCRHEKVCRHGNCTACEPCGDCQYEFFGDVAERLRVDAGIADAYTEQTGGGIVCVVIPCGEYLLYFGVANETWEADVWKKDGDKVDFLDRFVHTACPSSCTDASEVARALAKAAADFDQQNRKG